MFQVGSDGRTAYERTRGNKCKRQLPPFGERVFYLPTDRRRGRKNKFEAKWFSGVYIGLQVDSGELYIMTKSGVVRARAVKTTTANSQHMIEMLGEFRGAPWRPTPGSE